MTHYELIAWVFYGAGIIVLFGLVCTWAIAQIVHYRRVVAWLRWKK
jgi:hypothetical protein